MHHDAECSDTCIDTLGAASQYFIPNNNNFGTSLQLPLQNDSNKIPQHVYQK